MIPKKLKSMSLAAILSLGACVNVDAVPVRPFYSNLGDSLDTTITSSPNSPANGSVPVSSSHTLNVVYGASVQNNSNLQSYEFYDSKQEQQKSTLTNHLLGLPQELTRQDTSLDTGLVQIAVSNDDSLTVRPKYSQAYDFSLRANRLRIQEITHSEVPTYSDFRFRDDGLNDLPEDDFERVKYEEGVVISALTRFVWDLSIFKPARVVADQAKDYSNAAVRSVFGSHSEIDYSGGRLVFGFTGMSTDYFDLEFNAWAEISGSNEKGIIIEFSFHGNRSAR
mgnify:FL=1